MMAEVRLSNRKHSARVKEWEEERAAAGPLVCGALDSVVDTVITEAVRASAPDRFCRQWVVSLSLAGCVGVPRRSRGSWSWVCWRAKSPATARPSSSSSGSKGRPRSPDEDDGGAGRPTTTGAIPARTARAGRHVVLGASDKGAGALVGRLGARLAGRAALNCGRCSSRGKACHTTSSACGGSTPSRPNPPCKTLSSG